MPLNSNDLTTPDGPVEVPGVPDDDVVVVMRG